MLAIVLCRRHIYISRYVRYSMSMEREIPMDLPLGLPSLPCLTPLLLPSALLPSPLALSANCHCLRANRRRNVT